MDNSTPRKLDFFPSASTRKNRLVTPPSSTMVRSIFNRKMSWGTLLTRHGWNLLRIKGYPGQFWWYRGAATTVSGTIKDDGDDMLTISQENESPFECGRSYDKFSVCALLDYKGDLVITAQILARRGYGYEERVSQATDRAARNGRDIWPFSI